jgi:hypothetical protein
MRVQVVRRGGALAGALVLLMAGVAAADTVDADADLLLPGRQSTFDLGNVAPGAVVQIDVDFALVCGGTSHAVPGTTLTVNLASQTVPEDGDVSATDTTIGPVPETWPADGTWCPDTGTPWLAANAASVVTVTAPTVVGNGYEYALQFGRSSDTGLTNMTFVEVTLNVVAGSGGDPDPGTDPEDPGTDPVAWTAAWASPLGSGSPALVANQGRVVPLKVSITDGDAVLAPPADAPTLRLERLTACGGSVSATSDAGALRWDDGRWAFRLDTSGLDLGCWRLSVVVDEKAFGAVELQMVGGGSGTASSVRGGR